jgi:hypothetical protein
MDLYLPKDRSAREPRSATLAALSRGLDSTFHVWANVSFDKYEFDWLVFCERGWFGVYEEKTFERPVAETAGQGEDWTLVGGKRVENPGDQVNKHSEVFRRFVRNEIIPRFAPHTPERDVRNLHVWCGVYSPHVGAATRLVQPRWGRFYRSLDEFVHDLDERVPNVVLDLDRGQVSGIVERLNTKLRARPAQPGEAVSAADDADIAPQETAMTGDLLRRLEALEGRVAALEHDAARGAGMGTAGTPGPDRLASMPH